ncbi:MAG TPA: histidine kinase dimerization/phospho-acceptor domain-containing protein [Gemmatimonadales bacterium]|jgi:signal transduction histidine kinase
MTDLDDIGNLRHSLANPLSSILGEAQLILGSGVTLDEETRQGVQAIEQLALRMKTILQDSRSRGGSDDARREEIR